MSCCCCRFVGWTQEENLPFLHIPKGALLTCSSHLFFKNQFIARFSAKFEATVTVQVCYLHQSYNLMRKQWKGEEKLSLHPPFIACCLSNFFAVFSLQRSPSSGSRDKTNSPDLSSTGFIGGWAFDSLRARSPMASPGGDWLRHQR